MNASHLAHSAYVKLHKIKWRVNGQQQPITIWARHVLFMDPYRNTHYSRRPLGGRNESKEMKKKMVDHAKICSQGHYGHISLERTRQYYQYRRADIESHQCVHVKSILTHLIHKWGRLHTFLIDLPSDKLGSSPCLFSEIPQPSITIKHTLLFAMGRADLIAHVTAVT